MSEPEFAQFATDDGFIAYQVIEPQDGNAGKAEWLTLLHNFMSSGHAAWGPLVAELSQRYRLLLPDLPGHGRSIGQPAGYDHGVIAGQLAALQRSLGADRGHLAGCSSGGMLSQRMVHARLVQPATLTLVSTTYNTDPDVTKVGRVLVPEHFQAASNWLQATARLHDPYRYEGYFDHELLPGFRKLTPQTAIGLRLEALYEFDLPVCIIQGDRDEFFPPAIPEAIAATLPDAELHMIPKQTHALLFRQPWQVAKIMLEFLDKHPYSA